MKDSITKKVGGSGRTIEQFSTNDNKPSIAPEQAATLAHDWVMQFFNSDERIGDLLLVLRSLTYSDDAETILNSVERALLPFTLAGSDALDALVEQRFQAAQRGQEKG